MKLHKLECEGLIKGCTNQNILHIYARFCALTREQEVPSKGAIVPQ